LTFGTGIDLVEALLGLEKYTAAASPTLAQNVKVQTVISHANTINDRDLLPLPALKRAAAVSFDFPKRSDGLSFIKYGPEGHLLAPRPQPSWLESRAN
jgi:hypothetical protein